MQLGDCQDNLSIWMILKTNSSSLLPFTTLYLPALYPWSLPYWSPFILSFLIYFSSLPPPAHHSPSSASSYSSLSLSPRPLTFSSSLRSVVQPHFPVESLQCAASPWAGETLRRDTHTHSNTHKRSLQKQTFVAASCPFETVDAIPTFAFLILSEGQALFHWKLPWFHSTSWLLLVSTF